MEAQVRILVVDDDAAIRRVVSRALMRDGYDVYEAANGAEAMVYVGTGKRPPDLILLDIHLPDMRGDEWCRSIRQNPGTRDTPVLMISGKNVQGLSVRCLNEGADAYLSKPFGLPELLAHVRALLRRPARVVMDSVLVRGKLLMRLEERSVFWGDERLPKLSPKEFVILRELVTHSPHVVAKRNLALEAWGVPLEQLHARTIDVHVRRLRMKLGPLAADALRTVPVIGFQWLEQTPILCR